MKKTCDCTQIVSGMFVGRPGRYAGTAHLYSRSLPTVSCASIAEVCDRSTRDLRLT